MLEEDEWLPKIRQVRVGGRKTCIDWNISFTNFKRSNFNLQVIIIWIKIVIFHLRHSLFLIPVIFLSIGLIPGISLFALCSSVSFCWNISSMKVRTYFVPHISPQTLTVHGPN